MAFLPFSKFFFTHHMDPIIEEVKSNVEAEAASDSMVVQVYDPPSSRTYVSLLEAELARTRKALAQALKDHAHAKKEACRWFMIRDYFYKITGWKPPSPPTPPSSPIHLSYDFDDSDDEFLKKLDEKVVKQKGEKK